MIYYRYIDYIFMLAEIYDINEFLNVIVDKEIRNIFTDLN